MFKHERDRIPQFINILNFEWLENWADTVLHRTGCEVRKDTLNSGQR